MQVDHFVRFADDERVMPVVWHQTLLCFVQRYKDEVRATDKSALRKLCNIQCHKQVSTCAGCRRFLLLEGSFVYCDMWCHTQWRKLALGGVQILQHPVAQTDEMCFVCSGWVVTFAIHSVTNR